MTAAAFDLDETEPWRVDDPLDRRYRSGIVPEDQRWSSDFTYRPAPAPDSLTILKALGGRLLAKRVYANGKIVDYDKASRFDMTGCCVRPGLDDLEVILACLLKQPDRCVIRGAIASGRYVERNVPRRLHDREDGPATIAETDRQWLAIDIDDFPDEAALQRAERRISQISGAEHHLPRAVAPGDLISAAWVTTSALPAEFYTAETIVQATASHGLKPGLRVRLWFWLDRAITTAEAKYWFRHSPVDLSVFTPAQCIFTAAPIFEAGAVDPVPERLVRIPGRSAVKVPPAPDLRAKPKPQAARPDKPKAGVSPRGECALDDAEHAILGARLGQQEPSLVKQSYRIGCVVAAGDLPQHFARDVLAHIGRRLPDLDPAAPWDNAVVADKIDRAFTAGVTGRTTRHA